MNVAVKGEKSLPLLLGGEWVNYTVHHGGLTPAQVPEAKKTVDNHQVKFPGSRASTAQHVGVTELIFARGFEDMEQGCCVDGYVEGAFPQVKK